jgi:hypothetical protein
MAIRYASWRVFLPAILLFTLAIVPPLASLSLWLCGVIRDEIDLNFEIRCALSRESALHHVGISGTSRRVIRLLLS